MWASTIVTSQVSVDQWHEVIGDDPTLADAILDRLVHNAHRIKRRKLAENSWQATD